MPDKDAPSDRERMDQLLEEASLWFARMRGPDAEMHRAGFEHWLSLGASHLGAYNRAGEIFALGRFLAQERASQAEDLVTEPALLRSPRRKWPTMAMLLLSAVATGFVGYSYFLVRDIASPRSAVVAGDMAQTLSTVGQGQRAIKLADGSTITLSAETFLRVRFTDARRDLFLDRGTARFDVAHEARPFSVFAGGGKVTARGTLFDVSLGASRRVIVRLIRGAVDVERPGGAVSRAQTSPSSITKLHAGDELSFSVPAPISQGAKSDPRSKIVTDPSYTLIREFDGAPLAAVVTEVNRNSSTAIELSDSTMGAVKISGRFCVNDAEQMAERLSILFNLEAKKDAKETIILRQR